MRFQLIFMFLLIQIHNAVISTRCYFCHSQWMETISAGGSLVRSCLAQGPCAESPTLSVDGIEEMTCEQDEICTVWNVVGGWWNEGGILDGARTETITVIRECRPRRDDLTEGCVNDDNVPPGFLNSTTPPEIDIHPSTEVCVCDTDLCNDKPYPAKPLKRSTTT